MREKERDGLVLLLALAAGSLDAWSYFGVGHAFAANLTGNTVFLGVAFAGGQPQHIVNPALAIFFYAAGSVIGSLLARSKREDEVWPRWVSMILAWEAVLLAIMQWLWARHLPLTDHTSFIARVLLAGAALALGMQSGAMLKLRIPGIVTTYITGTWTTLMSGTAQLLAGRQRPKGANSRLEWEERLLMQAAVLATYCLSAALTWFVFLHWPRLTPSIALVAISGVAVYGAIRGE